MIEMKKRKKKKRKTPAFSVCPCSQVSLGDNTSCCALFCCLYTFKTVSEISQKKQIYFIVHTANTIQLGGWWLHHCVFVKLSAELCRGIG